MGTIYHVTEWNKPFVALTNPPALKNVADRFGYDFCVYSFTDFMNRNIDTDSDASSVWVFEAAYPQMANFSTKELRKYLPNGKLVCLGGDTIWFIRKNEHHINSPYEVDLWLDLMDEVVDLYKNLGIKADSWMWTISESMLVKFEEYTQNLPVDFSIKEHDFVSLISVCTEYRNQMKNYFQHVGYKGVFGVGCEADNVEDIIDVYRKSWFHLGTTSPSWTTGIRTMKGFRDWLAPALNTLLIYDNFGDVNRKFGGGSIVPTYAYDSFYSAHYLMEKLKRDRDLYENLLQHQKLWINRYTLENQFMRKFVEHNILNMESYNANNV